MSLEDQNPDLHKTVEPTTPLKEWLVNYVGEKKNPDNSEVNVEMVIHAMADEFPEILLAVAEENFIRGYKQALSDVEFHKNSSSEDVIQEKTENDA